MSRSRLAEGLAHGSSWRAGELTALTCKELQLIKSFTVCTPFYPGDVLVVVEFELVQHVAEKSVVSATKLFVQPLLGRAVVFPGRAYWHLVLSVCRP